ncbi:phage portal protein [Paenibacillus alvei]|uniref:Phage portal protein n=1 Tax=Paenibacillus alvei TaxID=44250 RepID=A0ABT4H7B7_PAEAL|nr:phage portal protein [Paenibacillus alvei]MCY9764789.1 phage portal protein [Paenibacillus alvei]MCY9770696.1 phage portal protein [Paenibacillus alvei]
MLTNRLQEIEEILNGNAPMSLSEICEEEIKEFKASEQYRIILEAERYYRNRSDVQQKTVTINNRSNVKMEHPVVKKLVDQKANYLLSKPFTVESDNKLYAEALNEICDNKFRLKIKSLGKGAVKSGVAYLAPYFEGGKLQFMRLPSTEVIPLWKDAEHTEIGAYIRFYDQIVYSGRNKKIVTRVEYWDSTGVKRFKNNGQGGTQLVPDTDFIPEESHFVYNGQPYNFETVPLAWVKYNEEELPLQYFIKDLIDDINWQSSVTSDVLRDVAKFIYILKGYGGVDLVEFIRDLRENMAIKIDGIDGGVDTLQADINVDAVLKFLDKNRRDLFDFAAAVDTKDPNLGNASGTAINFRYMDLDTDCAALATELQNTFLQMKVFFDVYLQIIGKGDFTKDSFSIKFNADMPVNETDIINNVRNSEGVVSKRTRAANHPWVQDVDEELEQIKKEQQEEMEQFGSGMFDGAIGAVGGDPPNGEEQ